jgi:hypothetical protein
LEGSSLGGRGSESRLALPGSCMQCAWKWYPVRDWCPHCPFIRLLHEKTTYIVKEILYPIHRLKLVIQLNPVFSALLADERNGQAT